MSTIIHKHDANSSSKDNNVVQSSINSIVSSQAQNSSKTATEDDAKMSSWHHPNNMSGSKMSSYPGTTMVNSDGMNDSSNDANKANYNAMTKKRKAMHQANSSNRSSADENTSK